MKYKYDIVIIGDTKHSIFAAEYSVKLGARVALAINHNLDEKHISSFLIDEYKNELLNLTHDISPQKFLAEKQKIVIKKYLPTLELWGVDIIKNPCYFKQEKKLTLFTDKDELEGKCYLLTMTFNQLFPKNTLIKNYQYLTIDDLILENHCHNLPKNIIIFGNDISTIYLANQLNKLNKNITIITENKQLLPSEDYDISFQFQLILESQGIKIHTSSHLDDFNFNQGKYQEYHQENFFQDSQLIILNTYNLFSDELGLKNLGINVNHGKISVNNKLQTQNHQIYACGNLLGGYALNTLVESEIKIAVNNGLFFPSQKINYTQIPYTLTTNPPIKRIGYTEKQAKLLLSNTINVLYLNILLELPLTLKTETIFIKIILDKNNYFLGFHSLGFCGEEIIATINLLIKEKKSITYLFKINFTQINSLIIIKNIQQAWREKNKRPHQFIISLAKTFFIWKND